MFKKRGAGSPGDAGGFSPSLFGTLCGAAKGGWTGPRVARVRARDRAHSAAGQDVLSAEPRPPAANPALCAGRVTRACSLWVLSLARARESTAPARMAGKTHRDVGRKRGEGDARAPSPYPLPQAGEGRKEAGEGKEEKRGRESARKREREKTRKWERGRTRASVRGESRARAGLRKNASAKKTAVPKDGGNNLQRDLQRETHH